jgi:ketosteroid isomerase-like protein
MRTTIAISIAIVTVLSIVTGSRAYASGDSDRVQIVALNQRQLEAFDRKDLDTVMSFYVDDKDAIFYEDTLPFQLVGVDALRRLDQEFFDSASQIHSTMEAISIVTCDDLAVAHYTLSVKWTGKDGAHSQRGRFSQVLKKVNGKWLIWHEHYSVPFDPATGRAVLEAKP